MGYDTVNVDGVCMTISLLASKIDQAILLGVAVGSHLETLSVCCLKAVNVSMFKFWGRWGSFVVDG